MAIYRESIVLLVVFTSVVMGVDLTVEEGAVGADVVAATVSKIESANIFPSDRRLLRRIAFVETADGENPPNGTLEGGIWNLKNGSFQRTKDINNSVIADVIALISTSFEADFSELGESGWESVEFDDLNRPLWSALAARLLIHIADRDFDIPTSSDIQGQASFWVTHYNTNGDVNKFVQDVEQLQDEGCSVNADIIFVLDSSGSIGFANYMQVIEFTHNFAEGLEIGPMENQVGVILFSFLGSIAFNLSTYSNKTELLNAINNIPYTRGGTNTADGLRVLIEEGFTEESGARLSANNIYRLAIVLTDGQSNDFTATVEAAERVHDFQPPILVFAIGVTNSVNNDELEAIATRPDNIILLSNFNQDLFQETTDEQMYELCERSTIPVMEGQMEVTLPEGGNVRYEVEVPDMGVTTRVCVHDGTVILFASYTVTNPNSAFHDFSFEVGSNGTTTCDDVFIPPESASRRRRQSVENATTTLFVSLVGVEEENEFEFQTVEGDMTDRNMSVTLIPSPTVEPPTKSVPRVSMGGDPHYSIMLPSGQLLCFSVHGEKGFPFNLISNNLLQINAFFIEDAIRDEITWIGSLGVVVQNAHYKKSNSTKIRFEAKDLMIYINSGVSMQAMRVEKLTLSNGRLIVSEAVRKGVEQKPEVEVNLVDVGLTFSVTFVKKRHLDMAWKKVVNQPNNSHGIIGQFMREGVKIDKVRKLLYLPSLPPVPVMRSSVWHFMESESPDPEQKLCWQAMNPGYQGKRLIEGSYLDYLVDDVLSSNFKFKSKSQQY